MDTVTGVGPGSILARGGGTPALMVLPRPCLASRREHLQPGSGASASLIHLSGVRECHDKTPAKGILQRFPQPQR
ncbi:hypothetical protein FQR65_LT03310 [Abscondita terminalis]|nr:hypothetical protein FQR65_LT03310 [Abscondita terminalis]